jgi:hypothetical protein
MSDIEQLPVFAYQLESLQDILDRVSRIGRTAGLDVVRDNHSDNPADIAWAFLAINDAGERKLPYQGGTSAAG